MKKDIHPDNYRPVIFKDVSGGERFLIGSAIKTKKIDKWEDGMEYPLFEIEVSSASHPFYTGEEKILDRTGRVERFKARATRALVAQEARNADKKKEKKQLAKQSTNTEGSISIVTDSQKDN